MTLRIFTITALTILVFTSSAFTQTTAFNFQGRLNDGSAPANGRYDLQFKLFDSATGGAPLATMETPNLLLINGVFSATLNFLSQPFASSDRFLEIGVKPAGSPNGYVILGARQQILSVPLAIRAVTAADADVAAFADNAGTAAFAINAGSASFASNAGSLGGVQASSYARLNFANQGDVSATNIAAAGYLSVAGNTTQQAGSNGLIKAMIEVDGYNGTQQPTIERCYNGVTGATTNGCGFTVSPFGSLEGVYLVNFGFPINQRFYSVTAKYNSAHTIANNVGVNYRFNAKWGVNVLEVFTFSLTNAEDTVAADFMIIVY